jgi:hypothetical protein
MPNRGARKERQAASRKQLEARSTEASERREPEKTFGFEYQENQKINYLFKNYFPY